MSVIVKGMEMPKCCAYCEIQYDGVCEMNTVESIDDIAYDGRPDWCPLVELPEKHGRLVDVDYLKEHIYACATNGRPLHSIFSDISEFMDAVDSIPTIIEAEGVVME